MLENPVEWFQNKMVESENDLTKKNALLEMKAMILNSEKKVLNDIIHNVSLRPVFACLIISDDHNVECICVIIHELLSELTAKEILESYGDLMEKCLSHNSKDVKEMILKLLEKSLDENSVGMLLSRHASLLAKATSCLNSAENTTAQVAKKLLIKIGSTAEGLNVLYSDLVINKLKEVMTTSDTARFDVYEIIVTISKVSAENLSKGISSGIMESFLSEISSSDILVELCALELLTDLVTSNHGFSYLQEQRVIQKLIEQLLNLKEETFASMLLPGLIEFFGKLCTSQPEHFINEYPQLMELLFNSIDTNDEVSLGVIITTVGKMGSTHAGRLILDKYKDQLKNSFLKKIGHILTTKNNFTLPAMSSLSDLVKNLDDSSTNETTTKEWFQSITPNALDSIVNLSKLPFIEYRVAAFALLKAIATQQWGTEALCNYPGMIEFLTDRSTEFNKDCKEMKFGIVLNMVQCPNIERVTTQQNLHNLKEFVKQGPFYVPTQVEMVTEGVL